MHLSVSLSLPFRLLSQSGYCISGNEKKMSKSMGNKKERETVHRHKASMRGGREGKPGAEAAAVSFTFGTDLTERQILKGNHYHTRRV